MTLPLKNFKNTLLFAFLTGFITDLLLFDGGQPIIGFFIIAPTTVILLIFILNFIKINKIVIYFLSIVFFFLAMLIGFYQWFELRGHGVPDMLLAADFLGTVPAIIIGSIFGHHFSHKFYQKTQ